MIIISGAERKIAMKSEWPPKSTKQLKGPSRGLVELYGNRAATYEAMIFAQPWLYACVRTFVIAIARVPANTYSGGDTDNNRQRERAHALPRLLKRPWRGGSRFQLFAEIAYDMFGPGGASLIVKMDSQGRRVPAGEEPDELWVVPYKYVQEERDHRGLIGFNVIIEGRTYPLLPSDVIHIPHPMGGRSPIEPLRRTAALEEASIDWQLNTLEQSGTPNGAWTTDKKLDPTTLPRLRAQLENIHGGPANRAFGIFDQGLDFKAISRTAVDTELIGQRKLSREEVAGAYGIPAPMIGILDHATYSNITELRRSFYVDTIAPYLTLIEDCIDAQLIAPIGAWDGLYVEFDMHDILKPDPEAEGRLMMLDMQSATTSTNERRKLRNLPPKGDVTDPNNPYDQVLFPANMMLPGASAEERQAANLAALLNSPNNALVDSLAVALARQGVPVPTGPDPLAAAIDGGTTQEA